MIGSFMRTVDVLTDPEDGSLLDGIIEHPLRIRTLMRNNRRKRKSLNDINYKIGKGSV
jgi:hypothetical protein